MNNRHLLQWIELSRSALNKNLDTLSRLAGKRIMAPSVKADAYGHGLPEMLSLLEERKDVPYVSVHSLEEAMTCRHAGWGRKIMVLGPIAHTQLDAVLDYDLEPVVTSKENLRQLGKLGERYKTKIFTHLKLETGTNRQGISEKEIPGVCGDLQKAPPARSARREHSFRQYRGYHQPRVRAVPVEQFQSDDRKTDPTWAETALPPHGVIGGASALRENEI